MFAIDKFGEDRLNGKWAVCHPLWDSASIKVRQAHMTVWENKRCSSDNRFFIFILEAFKAEADKYVPTINF